MTKQFYTSPAPPAAGPDIEPPGGGASDCVFTVPGDSSAAASEDAEAVKEVEADPGRTEPARHADEGQPASCTAADRPFDDLWRGAARWLPRYVVYRLQRPALHAGQRWAGGAFPGMPLRAVGQVRRALLVDVTLVEDVVDMVERVARSQAAKGKLPYDFVNFSGRVRAIAHGVTHRKANHLAAPLFVVPPAVEPPGSEPTPEDVALQRGLVGKALDAIDRLPPRHREVLLEQVARAAGERGEECGRCRSVARKRIERARDALHAALGLGPRKTQRGRRRRRGKTAG